MRKRKLIEKIMCGYDADISSYPDALRKMAELEKDNLVEVAQNAGKISVRVTSNGWPFARIAAACLDDYYKPQAGRHAKAI